MSEKIVLTNAEAMDRRIPIALNMLANKAFGYKLCWAIADITEAVERQSKKYSKATMALFQAHGAKKTQQGYAFDQLTGDEVKDAGKVPMPDVCKDELDKLADETMDHDIPLLELPSKLKGKDGKDIDAEYEPLIFIALRKFIKR